MTDQPRLTQKQAAKIMFVAGKWAQAAEAAGRSWNDYEPQQRRALQACQKQTEAAFADLVAQLTDSEGL